MQEAQEAVLRQPKHQGYASQKVENGPVPFSVSRDKRGC